mgnify:CR=1 FL=1
MILYHGSFLGIAKPDLVHSRPNVDFGRGFYVAPLYEQAAKWCGKFKHRGKDGIISRYEYDESREAELKTLKFDSYSEEWLDFILNRRSGKDLTDYDLVAGGVDLNQRERHAAKQERYGGNNGHSLYDLQFRRGIVFQPQGIELVAKDDKPGHRGGDDKAHQSHGALGLLDQSIIVALGVQNGEFRREHLGQLLPQL